MSKIDDILDDFSNLAQDTYNLGAKLEVNCDDDYRVLLDDTKKELCKALLKRFFRDRKDQKSNEDYGLSCIELASIIKAFFEQEDK